MSDSEQSESMATMATMLQRISTLSAEIDNQPSLNNQEKVAKLKELSSVFRSIQEVIDAVVENLEKPPLSDKVLQYWAKRAICCILSDTVADPTMQIEFFNKIAKKGFIHEIESYDDISPDEKQRLKDECFCFANRIIQQLEA